MENAGIGVEIGPKNNHMEANPKKRAHDLTEKKQILEGDLVHFHLTPVHYVGTICYN